MVMCTHDHHEVPHAHSTQFLTFTNTMCLPFCIYCAPNYVLCAHQSTAAASTAAQVALSEARKRNWEEAQGLAHPALPSPSPLLLNTPAASDLIAPPRPVARTRPPVCIPALFAPFAYPPSSPRLYAYPPSSPRLSQPPSQHCPSSSHPVLLITILIVFQGPHESGQNNSPD